MSKTVIEKELDSYLNRNTPSPVDGGFDDENGLRFWFKSRFAEMVYLAKMNICEDRASLPSTDEPRSCVAIPIPHVPSACAKLLSERFDRLMFGADSDADRMIVTNNSIVGLPRFPRNNLDHLLSLEPLAPSLFSWVTSDGCDVLLIGGLAVGYATDASWESCLPGHYSFRGEAQSSCKSRAGGRNAVTLMTAAVLSGHLDVDANEIAAVIRAAKEP